MIEKTRIRKTVAIVATLVVVALLWVPGAGATTRSVCAGCTYTTVQAAVDAAAAGDVITVSAGTYPGNVTVGKPLTIQGPNASVSPNKSSARIDPNLNRLSEAVIKGTITLTDGADGAVIKGLKFVDTDEGVSAMSSPPDNVTVSKNLFRVNKWAVHWEASTSVPATGGRAWQITDNRMEATATSAGADYTAILGWYLTNLTVTDNVIVGYGRGMQMPSAVEGDFLIRGNIFKDIAQRAVQVAFPGANENACGRPYGAGEVRVVIDANSFIGTNNVGTVDPTGSAAVRIKGYWDVDVDISLTRNLFTDSATKQTLQSAILWLGSPFDCGSELSSGLGADGHFAATGNRFALADGVEAISYAGPDDQTLPVVGNAWGAVDATAIADLTRLLPTGDAPTEVTFRTSPWIVEYTEDAAKAGKAGFWPVNVTYAADDSVPAAPTVRVVSAEAGSTLAFTVPEDDDLPLSEAPFDRADATIFDITATGTFTGPYTVCADATRTERLWHWEDTSADDEPAYAWVDITSRVVAPATQIDTPDGRVCGMTATLSPFAVVGDETKPVVAVSLADEIGTVGEPTEASATVEDATLAGVEYFDGTQNRVYTPAGGWAGQTSVAFDFTVTPARVGEEPICVSAYDRSINEAEDCATLAVVPSVDDFALTTMQNVPAYPTLAAEVGSGGDEPTFEIVTGPDHGTVSDPEATCILGGYCSATVEYVPEEDFSGTDVFTYTATVTIDGETYTSAPATVTVSVSTAYPTTIRYLEPTIDVDGNGSTTFKASLSADVDACTAAQTVTFATRPYGSTDDDAWRKRGTGTTNEDGDVMATWLYGATPPKAGVYEVRARFAGTVDCLSSEDATQTLTIGYPDDSVFQAGWYKIVLNRRVTKVSFGLNARSIVDPQTGSTLLRGQLVWVHQRYNRISGTSITGITRCEPSGSYSGCMRVTGSGTLSDWAADPSVSGGGRWTNPRAVTYTATVLDGGTGKVCSRWRCVTRKRGDAFGLSVDGVDLPGETDPVGLSGGSVRLD